MAPNGASWDIQDSENSEKFLELCKSTSTVTNRQSYINGSLVCRVSNYRDSGPPFFTRRVEILSVEPRVEFHHGVKSAKNIFYII